MISLTPHGRRAEEFNALIEGGADTGRERDAEFLEVVGALRAAPEVEPRPAYVADLRERLMAEAELVLSDVERKLTLPAGQRSRRDRRVAIAAGAIAFVGVSSSVAVASQGALPGDTLYPIKRAIEGASTSLTFDDVAKGDRMLDNASARLGEVQELSQRSSTTDEQFRDTLATFTSQSEEAADLLLDDYEDSGSSQGVEKLRVFTAESIETLSSLRDQLPAAALDSLQDAVGTLARIDDLASSLCPGCAGGIEELPANLAQLAVAAVKPEKAPAAKAPTILPERTYTDESQIGTPPGQQQTQDSERPPATPPQQPQSPSPKNPKGPALPEVDKTTKDLGDLVAGEKGLLGKEGPVGGLLDSLLGEKGLLDNLLGGSSSSDSE